MRSIQLILPAVLIASLGTEGCGPTVEYRPDRPAQVVKAPITGVYELYPRGKHRPVYDTVLLSGDPIGFARDGQGRLVAVAAAERHALPEGKYRWRFDPDPGGSGSFRITPHDVLEILPTLGGLLLRVGIEGAVKVASDAADDAIEKEGKTKYQRDKQERLVRLAPSSDDGP